MAEETAALTAAGTTPPSSSSPAGQIDPATIHSSSTVDKGSLQSRALPPPFDLTSTKSSFELISQGAEALLYKTTFLTADTPAALKVRPAKAWRHPQLDRRLTRSRVLAEARVLVRVAREGVCVPALLGLDLDNGWIACEWVHGQTVKAAIREWRRVTQESDSPALLEAQRGENGDGLTELLHKIGQAVGRLHAIGVVHGDLTTSNMMLRQNATQQADVLSGEIVLIDFGLATAATQEEDRAVDLYVLERAFGSTHPKEEDRFPEVLEAYAGSYKGARTTLKRLEDVRMRGRKKSMLG